MSHQRQESSVRLNQRFFIELVENSVKRLLGHARSQTNYRPPPYVLGADGRLQLLERNLNVKIPKGVRQGQ